MSGSSPVAFLCVLYAQKVPRGLGLLSLAPYPPAGARVNCFLLWLLGTLPCSHVLWLPRIGQEYRHLRDPMFGALAAGLQTGYRRFAGHLLGGIGEAVGGSGSKPYLGRSRDNRSCSGAQVSPRGSGGSREDSVAQSWGLGERKLEIM